MPNALQGLLAPVEMRETPRKNKLMGLLADALQSANDYAQRPDPRMPMGKANPVLGLLADAASLQSLATTANRVSYGEPLTNGLRGSRPLLKPETADALMMAPLSPRNALAALGAVGGVGDVGRAVIPAAAVKAMGKKAALPDDELFRAAVANTPGASLGDDGLMLALQRNQRPEQGMMPSTRGGVFYLPEGAAQAKHYSTGKSGYGGSERITGETLIQSPMFVKGATGGKAPEAAYDAIAGKGAYQGMRNEAIKAYGPYGAGTQARTQLVREFLAKHAPELADQADYIVRNSAQGNQLAYALQEAAVGSAVRRAGHDAVLGYSKQKTGNPFISEVFDVRERVYPDKFGGYGMWGE